LSSFLLSQAIYKASKTRRIIMQADRRRLTNRIAHSKPGSVKVKPERKKKLLAEVE
jgi:WD repeat and SOF domain-containing protein 1